MSEQKSVAPYLHVETIGSGPDLVMLHGWGLNGAVWQPLATQLSQHYTLHLVDLPGFGDSDLLADYLLPEIARHLLSVLPKQATWLGWSLGGLVATQVALMAPERVSHLILVASSPKFVADGGWPGIKPEVLQQFQQQLQQDFTRTLERFLAIQAMGSPTARDDVKALKRQLNARREPHPSALASGLKLLETVDLRQELSNLKLPVSRFYGRLDALVPAAAQTLISELCAGDDVCFSKASHAPFISHGELFAETLRNCLEKH